MARCGIDGLDVQWPIVCTMTFGGEDRLRINVGGPLLCLFHASAELVDGPYPVRDEHGIRYYRSVRCTEGGELYAAETGPPPFIKVEVEIPPPLPPSA